MIEPAHKPIVRNLKDMIREPFAFPGGYAKVLTMADGETMCHTCAKENFRLILADTKIACNSTCQSGWAAAGVDIYWEGPPMYCANCNSTINSEYGDPEAA